MPISTRWEDDNRIVIWEFQGVWTWDEYYNQRGAVNDAIRERDHIVHMIIDMTNSNLLPKNPLTHGTSAMRQAPTNIGTTVYVGSNTVLRAFFKMFSQIYGAVRSSKKLDMHMVATLDEAHALIKSEGAGKAQ